MKKVKIVSIILMLFAIFAHSVYAFSNDYYSIDIPTSYTQVSENSFTDEYGRNINIQIVPFSGRGKGSPYTQERLNELADNYANEIESLKDEAKKMLIEKNTKYGANLSEEEINEYVDSIKFLGVEKKGITTFSKNNYECFHLIVKASMGGIITYSNQYSVASGNNIYTLTFSSDNLSDFNTYEITKIIESFTIKNFKKPYTDEEESLGEKMFVAFFSTLIFCGIGALINKKQKRKNIEVIDKKTEIIEDNNNAIKNEEYNIDKENIQKKDVKNRKNIFMYMFFIAIFIIIIMGIYILNLSKDNNEDKKTSSGTSNSSSSKNYFLNEDGELYVIEENGVKVYNASHILVDDKKTAEEIILRLDKGEKFEDLMNEYYGENLGNFYEGVMVEEFEEAVAKLNVNEYTKEPIKSEYGYHIILRNKTN